MPNEDDYAGNPTADEMQEMVDQNRRILGLPPQERTPTWQELGLESIRVALDALADITRGNLSTAAEGLKMAADKLEMAAEMRKSN